LLGVSEKGSPQHATALLTEVERAAAAAGGWGSVSSVAVGLGPGSFTGLRVGMATARGVAMTRGLPLAGVCTLDAIGAALAERAGAGGCSLALLDARRGEVFSALYRAGAERRWGPSVSSPAELGERIAQLERPPLAAGSGAVRFRQELVSCGVEIPDDADQVHRVSARRICALAAAGNEDQAGPTAPIYLRPPDAERWRERDTVQTTE